MQPGEQNTRTEETDVRECVLFLFLSPATTASMVRSHRAKAVNGEPRIFAAFC